MSKPGFVRNAQDDSEHSAQQPIHVRIAVGRTVGELTLVGDPHDAMMAVQIGRAIGVWLLENA